MQCICVEVRKQCCIVGSLLLLCMNSETCTQVARQPSRQMSGPAEPSFLPNSEFVIFANGNL